MTYWFCSGEGKSDSDGWRLGDFLPTAFNLQWSAKPVGASRALLKGFWSVNRRGFYDSKHVLPGFLQNDMLAVVIKA